MQGVDEEWDGWIAGKEIGNAHLPWNKGCTLNSLNPRAVIKSTDIEWQARNKWAEWWQSTEVITSRGKVILLLWKRKN